MDQNWWLQMAFPPILLTKRLLKKNTISRWITYKTCGFQSISRWITYKKIWFSMAMWLSLKKLPSTCPFQRFFWGFRLHHADGGLQAGDQVTQLVVLRPQRSLGSPKWGDPGGSRGTQGCQKWIEMDRNGKYQWPSMAHKIWSYNVLYGTVAPF